MSEFNIFETRQVHHIPHSFPKEDELSSLPETFKATYIITRDKWKYTARITQLLELLQYSYGIKEFELIEWTRVNNGMLQAEWMDALIEFKSGKGVDFGKLWEDMKKELEFSIKELNIIETGEVDVRLWAIFTVLSDPNLPITYK